MISRLRAAGPRALRALGPAALRRDITRSTSYRARERGDIGWLSPRNRVVNPQLFQNCYDITTRYPPQIGWITCVIPLKMSADNHVIHLVIALKTKSRGITYFQIGYPPKMPK